MRLILQSCGCIARLSFSREELIKQHYSAKAAQLAKQIQFSDSKATAYYEECRALAMQLEARLAIICQVTSHPSCQMFQSRANANKDEHDV